MLFSGKGLVELALIDASGNAGLRFDLGCLDSLDLAITTEEWKKYEKCTGQNLLIGSGEKSKDVTGSFSAAEWKSKTLEQLMRGALKTLSGDTGGTVTGETINATEIPVGAYYDTKRVGITSVVVTDSTPLTPLTVTNTKYVVTGATGRIAFGATFDDADYVLPLKVAYTYAEPNFIALFTQGVQAVNLRYHFKNQQNNNAPGILELYKVNIGTAKNLTLLNDEAAAFDADLTCLADLSRSATGPLGQFGRIIDASLV